MIVNNDCNHSFKVLATVVTTVNYNRKTFTVQATGLGSSKELKMEWDELTRQFA
jgi:hypothetical protein